ncbi:MAG: C45 family peptidase [Bacteroidales bacterium]|nr:C45 family peptidase [Bacteroidales bacterium]
MLKKRVIRIMIRVAVILTVLFLALWVFYRFSTVVREPEIPAGEKKELVRIALNDSSFVCENGWLRKSREGWWEMYLEGSPYEIGFAHGLLTEELMAWQEKAFTEKLAEFLPTRFYQRFMLTFVRFFNRNLDRHVQPEYRKEIFGISRSAPPEYDFIGPAYARMLNYHAAHDIGHAVQNMNLVACTAFGAWDDVTADSCLLIGRNFDFYINDDFAENKILCFMRPDSGYSFVSVTWAGFAGVVSGMNEKGLTVTLNAAKSSIPLGAKTPVSLLAREILQYAANIDEAIAIVRSRETFVAESFLIGSAIDRKVVVIEKMPDKMAIFDPGENHILLTNHFQSETFLYHPLNVENMENGISTSRLERLRELVEEHPAMTVEDAVTILRDDRGTGGKALERGDERAINQYIAHHAIIFHPESKTLWVSNPPWQLGAFHGYHFDRVFLNGMNGIHLHPLYDGEQTVDAYKR